MFQPVIKWSGSKRSQANTILSYLPQEFNCYYEPFLGGGSMLYAINPSKAICGDVCESLIDLWNKIKAEPNELAQSYRTRWERLQEEGYLAYYSIRDDYNLSKKAEDLLFLSRTCVNGLIRFNADGEFNNSLHHTRSGIHPDKLEKIIKDWSTRIQNSTFISADYEYTTQTVKEGDLVYLDPPYFHTKGRYYGTIDYDRFLNYLDFLNKRGAKYILSFDGKRGDDDFTVAIPKDLYKRHEFIPSGKSSFKKVMDKEYLEVYESLYLNW
ncbi:MAG: Dam family site-specific DNA-(adenine-N6)-methyltransferase [Clostridia bacterium]|nr:Dam family site-specific DNA-(adenine-N6)-methyltransferase [Clostridia bacterium]